MKNKLLLTSALVGVVGLAGTANAEFKVGGDIINTITFGAADAAGALASDNRIGTEMNLKLSGSADLNNGWKAIYAAKWEKDSSGADEPDHEYELKLQSGNMYVAINNDYGQSNAQWNTPYISYPASSAASAIAIGTFTADRYIKEVKESESIGFGGKIGNGSAVVRYAPKTGSEQGNDVQSAVTANSSATHGSGYLIAYKGDLGGGFGLNAAYTKMSKNDQSITGEDDALEKRIGASYKMGAVTVGADVIRYTAGANSSNTGDYNTNTYGIAYAASDAISVGAYYTVTTDERSVGTAGQDEQYKMLSVGYNLGPASIAVNLVDIEGLANAASTTNGDYQGVQIVTKVNF